MNSISPRIGLEAFALTGFVGSLGNKLFATGLPAASAWLEVVGPSKLITLSLVLAFVSWVIGNLNQVRPPLAYVATGSTALGVFVPGEVWSAVLVCAAILSAAKGRKEATALLSVSACSLYVVIQGGQLPSLISVAVLSDAILVAGLTELLGRDVEIHGPVLFVDQGVSLRLIGPCSSILPSLTVVAAVGAGLGFSDFGGTRRKIVTIALSVVAVICANTLRLAAMTGSKDAYDALHHGVGSLAFRLFILALIVLALAGAIPRRPVS